MTRPTIELGKEQKVEVAPESVCSLRPAWVEIPWLSYALCERTRSLRP